jgi:UPF0271 protein
MSTFTGNRRTSIDLMADVGEGFGPYSKTDDEAILDIVSSANIACGFHAGDPVIMDKVTQLCVERGVRIGAHPSLPDLRGFGRRPMELNKHEITTDVLYQLGALSVFAKSNGGAVEHITPHGSLGNMVTVRRDYAEAVADAVQAFDTSVILMAQDGFMAEVGRERGLSIQIFGLTDRNYNDDGTLVSRREQNAVITDADLISARTIRMIEDGTIESINGRPISIRCDSVLLHGDTAGSINLARRIKEDLQRNNIQIAAKM